MYTLQNSPLTSSQFDLYNKPGEIGAVHAASEAARSVEILAEDVYKANNEIDPVQCITDQFIGLLNGPCFSNPENQFVKMVATINLFLLKRKMGYIQSFIIKRGYFLRTRSCDINNFGVMISDN